MKKDYCEVQSESKGSLTKKSPLQSIKRLAAAACTVIVMGGGCSLG